MNELKELGIDTGVAKVESEKMFEEDGLITGKNIINQRRLEKK